MAALMTVALRKSLLIQTAVMVVSLIINLILSGFVAGVWAFIGGICSLLPALIFGLMIQGREQDEPAQFLRVFMFGELVKIVITVLLLLLAMNFVPKEARPLLGLLSGFGATVLSQVVTSLIMRINGGTAK